MKKAKFLMIAAFVVAIAGGIASNANASRVTAGFWQGTPNDCVTTDCVQNPTHPTCGVLTYTDDHCSNPITLQRK